MYLHGHLLGREYRGRQGDILQTTKSPFNVAVSCGGESRCLAGQCRGGDAPGPVLVCEPQLRRGGGEPLRGDRTNIGSDHSGGERRGCACSQCEPGWEGGSTGTTILKASQGIGGGTVEDGGEF